MRVRNAEFVAGAFVMAVQCVAPLFGIELSAFAPAFYDPGPGRGDAPKLHVFPVDGPKFTLALPFQVGNVAVSPDGESLYVQRFFDPTGPNTGLYKIEFGPTRATRLAGSKGLTSVYGITASSTKIVVSAGYLNHAGLTSRCGLYELILSSGDVHQILSNSDCEYASSWSSISLSPDSRKIIAVRKHRLELIDTETKAVQSLGDGFYNAAWSPDGRWIAALGDNGDHTVLIDTTAFDKRRTLPPSEVIWSPDSHSLLASRLHWLCLSPYVGTLHLIDIESGKTSIVRSSTCQVSMVVFGWINVAARQ
jgi:WD40 repeat protein